MKNYGPIGVAERASNDRKRNRDVCKRGHDLTLPGAVTIRIGGNGRPFRRCSVCRDAEIARFRDATRANATHCVKGHDLTAPNGKTARGSCSVCAAATKRAFAVNTERQRSRQRPNMSRWLNSIDARLLEMVGKRELCGSAMERAEFDAEWDQLMCWKKQASKGASEA